MTASFGGLLQLRSQTYVALILAEIAAFTLLALAQIRGAGAPAVFAGIVYFLVGAAVGLFGHLYRLSRAEAAVNDYGLAVARILTVPIFSGLAAVAGVVLQSLAGLSAGHPQDLPVIERSDRPSPSGNHRFTSPSASTHAPGIPQDAGESHQTKDEAVRIAAASGNSGIRAYRCKFCMHWHTGNVGAPSKKLT